MPPGQKIFLIGMMYSGKSTVGSILSRRLAWPFLDLDEAIETHSQATIPELFKTIGEKGFRALEGEILKQSLSTSPQVIATGGGIILSEANRTLMRKSGSVFYLKTDLKTLLTRAEALPDSHRPLLAKGQPQDHLVRIFQERKSLYDQTAHYTLETGGKTPSDLVNEIIQTLNRSR